VERKFIHTKYRERKRGKVEALFSLILQWALVATIGFLSCYSFSARTSTHIASVAVPFFENRTNRYGLDDQLTTAVAQGFLEDRALKVVDEGEADSVLRGSVTEYERKAAVFDEIESVTKVRIVITIDVTYRDLVTGNIVWEQKGLSEWGEYRPVPFGDQPAETEEDGQNEAIEKIVQDILARSIETW
jgi:hypothetical protein